MADLETRLQRIGNDIVITTDDENKDDKHNVHDDKSYYWKLWISYYSWLTTGFWGKEAWRPTPKWNTRFFFSFSKRTQLWLCKFISMGTLKSVCSSWFALISRDKYEHTHLRGPIFSFFFQPAFLAIHDCQSTYKKSAEKAWPCLAKTVNSSSLV